jgi:hypothetical protein
MTVPNKQMQPTKCDGRFGWPAPRANLAQARFAADLQRWADAMKCVREAK